MRYPCILALGLCCFCWQARASTLEVTPGTLASLLTDEVRADASLTLTGAMDVRDFQTLTGQMPSLKSLDLGGVTIAGYLTPLGRSAGVPGGEFLPDELPTGALLGLRLETLTLPSTLKVIGEGALASQALVTLTIPEGVTTIAPNALYGNEALETLTLPSTLQTLGSYSLAGCTSLREVDLGHTRVKSIPSHLFTGDMALRTVKLPVGLNYIEPHAFTSMGLKTITLPQNVLSVGDFAFCDCPDLLSVSSLSPAATLGRGLFFNCPAFVTFTAPVLEQFPDYLFTGSPNASVAEHLPGVTEIGVYALKDNAAQSLQFGKSLVYMGDGALEDMTSLDSIDVTALESNVPALGSDVFAGIDQPSVKLTVADGTKGAWEAADQWREFELSPLTSSESVTMTPAQGKVRAWFEGTLLHLTSASPITSVSLYSPDGTLLARTTPAGSAEAQAEAPLAATIDTAPFPGPLFLVRAQTADNTVTLFKLIR